MANRGNNVISNLVREKRVLESEKPLVYKEQAVMSISSLCKDLK